MSKLPEVYRKSSVRSFSSDLGTVQEAMEDSVFATTRDEQTSPSDRDPTSSPTGTPIETIQRTPSVREVMKAKIKYHNMNPWQKYRARGRKPWKLIVQVVKIILVTVQVCLFGLDRFSLVLFLENNHIALRHLFLKDYQDNAKVVVYDRKELYDQLHYAHEQYYQIQTVPLGNYDYTRMINGSTAPPVILCYSYYAGELVTDNNAFKIGPRIKEDYTCMSLPVPKNHEHLIGNNTFNLGRLRQVQMFFSLKTVNLKDVKAWDKPACYQLNVEILFDNTEHDGRMPVDLNMNNTWLPHCKGYIKGRNRLKTHFITVSLVIFDAIVITLCVISLMLCVRSVYRSLKLAKEAAVFFKEELAVTFTWSDYREFVSLWFFIIMLSDFLTILGSTYKMSIDQKDRDYYDICSLFLGCAVLLVWVGLLRFLGYFRKYNVLLVTLRAATPSVARFCLCASLLFIGFMFCGWIVLGPFHPKFKSLTITAECLYSMINGDDLFNTYALLDQTQTPGVVWIFSKIYIYTFIALFIYVVLSLFIGIIGDTYERLKDMGHLPKTKIQKFLYEPANAGRRQQTAVVPGDSSDSMQTRTNDHRHLWRTPSSGTMTDSIMHIVSIDSTGAE